MSFLSAFLDDELPHCSRRCLLILEWFLEQFSQQRHNEV